MTIHPQTRPLHRQWARVHAKVLKRPKLKLILLAKWNILPAIMQDLVGRESNARALTARCIAKNSVTVQMIARVDFRVALVRLVMRLARLRVANATKTCANATQTYVSHVVPGIHWKQLLDAPMLESKGKRQRWF